MQASCGNLWLLHLGTIIVLASAAAFPGCSNHASEQKTERAGPSERDPVRQVNDLRNLGRLDEAADAAYSAFLTELPEALAEELRLLVARIESERDNSDRAIELLAEIDLTQSTVSAPAAELLTRLAIESQRLDLAEKTIAAMVPVSPEPASWRQLWWTLLQSQGRLQEASDQAESLCRLGRAGIPQMLSLINRNEVFPIPQQDQPPPGFAKRSPALRARWHLARKQYSDAAKCFTPDVIDDEPAEPFAHASDAALYLRIVAELQDESAFLRTLARHGDQMSPFADHWFALGTYWIDHGDNDRATGAFLRAVQVDPTMRVAFQKLSRSCAALGRSDDAHQFRNRGVEIAETETIARRIEENSALGEARSELARRLLELGRPLEALEWTRSVMPSQAKAQLEQIARQRIQVVANPEHTLMPAEAALLGLNPDDFPLDDSIGNLIARFKSSDQPARQASRSTEMHSVRLVDVAKERGADFQWYHDRNLKIETIPLYESVGGGIAAFDMDLDGWPDLYFAQGGGSPPKLPMSRSNELRRNQSGFFVDVTSASLSDDRHYSGGIAAGDINQDGFPDLYLGAIGKNRLLINQGDGTFRDHSESIETDTDFFTASVAIADLNGDSIPELFEVNYIEMDGAFARPKQGQDGRYELPSPLLFYPQADRVFWPDGAGNFSAEPVDESVATPATGLGLVISDIDGRPGNEVFVGNDLRDNHLLAFDDGQIRNTANVLGVANGATGLANGCMGISTGDFDANGTFDLHVGNYRGESDNLFLQAGTGLFRDEATPRRLSEISRPLVAFGSKATDFDGNGSLDLAVTNGHIFDMRPMNQGYQMKPHLLLSDGFAFHRQTATELGEYWNGQYLGRSMLMIDFDRDLRTDLVIGHLDAPTALLHNRTENQATRVWLELVGTRSERDAIGARVVVYGESRSVTQWVTAGDGYYCSDEPCMAISLGDDPAIRNIEIHWPGGQTSRFDQVESGRRYLAIEGDSELFSRSVPGAH